MMMVLLSCVCVMWCGGVGDVLGVCVCVNVGM